jgi:hypothetical protein
LDLDGGHDGVPRSFEGDEQASPGVFSSFAP